ncbi:MAG: RNA-binding domain-containing protein [Nitrososphaerales archaeon]
MLFKSAFISFLSHATEDEEKLLEQLSLFFNLNKKFFKRSRLEGYFDNPIIKFDAQVLGDKADEIAKLIMRRLNDYDRLYLSKHLEDFIDSHGDLHLRINKQGIFKGMVKLEQADSIKIRLKSLKGSRYRKEALQAYLKLINEG